jgi:hypothetical protein
MAKCEHANSKKRVAYAARREKGCKGEWDWFDMPRDLQFNEISIWRLAFEIDGIIVVQACMLIPCVHS